MEEISGKTQDFSSITKDLSSRLSSISSKSSTLTPERNSYMDLKISLLLSYYTNYLLNSYQSSKSLPDTTSSSLIKLKTFIERLKPLDHKLSYQLDKIAQGSVDEDLKLKPNPSNMDSQLTVTEKEGIYKAPKIKAVMYKDKKSERDNERLKQKLARSTLIKTLKDELDEAPEEIRTGSNRKLKEIEDLQAQFEEENFMRVNLTKEEKKIRRKLGKIDNDDQTEDVSALLKLIKPDKKALRDTLDYKQKKRKLDR